MRLYVFVGEKISIEQKKLEKGAFDNAFIAKYQVLENVYNDV